MELWRSVGTKIEWIVEESKILSYEFNRLNTEKEEVYIPLSECNKGEQNLRNFYSSEVEQFSIISYKLEKIYWNTKKI